MKASKCSICGLCGALGGDARRDFLDRQRAVEHEADRVVDVAALGRVESGALQARRG